MLRKLSCGKITRECDKGLKGGWGIAATVRG